MGKLYNRADIVNFMKVGSETTYTRMTGFTEAGESSNVETYERRYVDEKTKRKDVVGFAKEIGYGFDREVGDALHDDLANINDKEMVGETREIVTVNFNDPGTTTGTFKARKRTYSIIPNAAGDGTDAYQYSGTFAAQGDIIEGTASSADKFKSVTFTADVSESI